jgi:UDP-N-acetylglucosamine--N-acetylmuramyl-(pentapeptide) pyrophosphoryl-undecaprenol N-acetylglucosamine transferase
MGGSLGARTLNNAVLHEIENIRQSNVEILWQTGKYYYQPIKDSLGNTVPENLHLLDFVSRMDLAYNISDLIISRAGALSLSELCLVGKPSLLVPSPNVAEDHQTKNALALVNVGAARMIPDSEAVERLIPEALQLIKDKAALDQLGKNAFLQAKPDATSNIVDEVLKLIGR